MENGISTIPSRPHSVNGARHVLLIAGNERRFAQDVVQLTAFYRRRGAGALTTMHTAYMDSRTFRHGVSDAVTAAGTKPLLIVYSGHGGPTGWAFSVPGNYSYIELCHLLAARTSGRTLLVNACCHALAITHPIEKVDALKSRVSVIAACDADKVTSVSLVGDVLLRWRASQPFVPRIQRIRRVRVTVKSSPSAEALEDDEIDLPPLKETYLGERRQDLGERRWGPEFDRQFFQP